MGALEQDRARGTLPSPPARRRPADAAVIGITALVAAVVFLVVRGALIDDAYITLSYARNLAEHLHWGLTPYRTANSATSPLNVLVLGAAAFVVRDAVWGLGVVLVVLSGLQAWGLLRLTRALRLPAWAALGAALMALLSPLMLAIVGMEMTLALTLVVWATVAAAEGRPVLFGVLAALLVLTRVDLAVFPLVLWLTTRTLRRRSLAVATSALLTAAPWYVFSWFALGALVPDTLVIKTVSSSAWGPWEFGNGWDLYLERYPTPVVLAAVPALAGLLALVVWTVTRAWRYPRWQGLGPVAALGLGGVGHYAAYSVLAPPPYHWYYAPSVGALTIVAALAAGALARRPAKALDPAGDPIADADRPGRRLPGGVRLPALVGLALVGAALLVQVAFLVRRAPVWDYAPITTNWASAEQYLAMGEDLRDEVGDDVVRSPGEIGTIAYACRCDIVDLFADRGTLLPQITQREDEAGPVMRALLDLNFVNLDRDVGAAVPDVALDWFPPGAGRWPVGSPWRGAGSFALHSP